MTLAWPLRSQFAAYAHSQDRCHGWQSPADLRRFVWALARDGLLSTPGDSVRRIPCILYELWPNDRMILTALEMDEATAKNTKVEKRPVCRSIHLSVTLSNTLNYGVAVVHDHPS